MAMDLTEGTAAGVHAYAQPPAMLPSTYPLSLYQRQHQQHQHHQHHQHHQQQQQAAAAAAGWGGMAPIAFGAAGWGGGVTSWSQVI